MHPELWLGLGLLLIGFAHGEATALCNDSSDARDLLRYCPLPLINAGGIGKILLISFGLLLFTRGVDKVLTASNPEEHP